MISQSLNVNNINNRKQYPTAYIKRESLNVGFRTGLDFLHKLTTSEKYELRVDLEDFQNNRVYGKYRYLEGEDIMCSECSRIARFYSKEQQMPTLDNFATSDNSKTRHNALHD